MRHDLHCADVDPGELRPFNAALVGGRRAGICAIIDRAATRLRQMGECGAAIVGQRPEEKVCDVISSSAAGEPAGVVIRQTVIAGNSPEAITIGAV